MKRIGVNLVNMSTVAASCSRKPSLRASGALPATTDRR
ncbi:Uncharacterised protein [Mycobacteroides abscessus subsp. abscessus]|nr:Uncharacterised protein [Mycobacteroides abscessus subsp. abscessus]